MIPPRCILSPNGCSAQDDAADKAGTTDDKTQANGSASISRSVSSMYMRQARLLFRLANDADGRSALTERLRALGVRGVVLEATGGLERPVLAALIGGRAAGQHRQSRPGAGLRRRHGPARQDRQDRRQGAGRLRRLHAASAGRTCPPSCPRQSSRNCWPTGHRSARRSWPAASQLKLYESDGLRARAQDALEALRRERRELEREIVTLVEERGAELVCSLPEYSHLCSAVGTIVGATLVAELPELGACVGGASPPSPEWRHSPATAASGAAIANPGRARGRSRKALFMASLVAIQHNPKIKSFYQRLRATGKPGKARDRRRHAQAADHPQRHAHFFFFFLKKKKKKKKPPPPPPPPKNFNSPARSAPSCSRSRASCPRPAPWSRPARRSPRRATSPHRACSWAAPIWLCSISRAAAVTGMARPSRGRARGRDRGPCAAAPA